MMNEHLLVNRPLVPLARALLVIALLQAGTSFETLMACSNQIDHISWAQRCSTGRWCDSETCGSCPECWTNCSCDCNVICPCFPGWISACSCWASDCGGGGSGSTRPEALGVVASTPTVTTLCGAQKSTQKAKQVRKGEHNRKGRTRPCDRCTS